MENRKVFTSPRSQPDSLDTIKKLCLKVITYYLAQEGIYDKNVIEELATCLFENIFKRLGTITHLKTYISQAAKHDVTRYCKRLSETDIVPIDDFEVESNDLKTWQSDFVREDYNDFIAEQAAIVRQNISSFEYALLMTWSEKDHSYKQLAEIFNESETKIRNTINRVRQKCRELRENGTIRY